VLIVEQRAKAVLAISDRTYVLAGGEVRMEGTPAELTNAPAFVESFLGGTVARLQQHVAADLGGAGTASTGAAP
jgi:ABC-type lipopolysaccharide export system ATPase subunit